MALEAPLGLRIPALMDVVTWRRYFVAVQQTAVEGAGTVVFGAHVAGPSGAWYSMLGLDLATDARCFTSL